MPVRSFPQEIHRLDRLHVGHVVATTAKYAIARSLKLETGRFIVDADGQAKANAILNASLTPTLVQWQEILKWDGKLPQVTGGASPFVSLSAR